MSSCAMAADWDGLEAALIQRVKDRISPHVAPRWVERRREPADDGHRQDHAAGIARVNRR